MSYLISPEVNHIGFLVTLVVLRRDIYVFFCLPRVNSGVKYMGVIVIPNAKRIAFAIV